MAAVALGRSGDSLCARLGGAGAKVLVSTASCPILPVAGESFTVAVSRRTRHGGFWLLEGVIRSPRLVESELGLEPLRLEPRGGFPVEYELEAVEPRLPGLSQSGKRALDEIASFRDSGDVDLAEMLAGELLARDLRCLEAHALLGSLFLDAPLEERWTERALRHYRVGVTVGEQSLGADFEGCLPWRWAGNRGLLCCLHGYARCLQRVGEIGAAWKVFRRLLELAPEDPLDARAMLEPEL